jgi:hypothetical protein
MQQREDRVDLFQGIITVWYTRTSVTVTGTTNGRHIHGHSLHHTHTSKAEILEVKQSLRREESQL